MTINPTQKRVWDAAKAYHQVGFSVIPCKANKKPVSDWRVFTINRVKEQRLEHWFVDMAYPSIGLVGGDVSDNIVFIDLDGIPAVKMFHEQFPYITNHTRSILTGSQQGVHLYLRVAKMPKNTNVRVPNVGGFEIRGTGQYVIAPPSPHASGKNYSIHRDHPIMETDNLEDVYQWMQSLKDNSHQKQAISEAARPQNVTTQGNVSNYINKIMSEEVAKVQLAPKGARNSTLFSVACNLAALSASGYVVWSEIVARLMIASSLPYGEKLKTLESAYQKGLSNPRVIR